MSFKNNTSISHVLSQFRKFRKVCPCWLLGPDLTVHLEKNGLHYGRDNTHILTPGENYMVMHLTEKIVFNLTRHKNKT